MLEARMRELVDLLNGYAHAYYVLDDPIVSDKEYDRLYDELLQLETESGVIYSDSPTKRVGGETIKEFSQHEHIARLYSLDKAQSLAELDSFFERIQKIIKNPEYTVEYKFDGLTLNLTYEDGEFKRATTRGNGAVGEDVTAQVLTIKSFPIRIDAPGTLEIQGEGIMRKSVFERYNLSAKEPLKNPRNAVAGSIRNLDPKLTASRKLDIMFYNINYSSDIKFESQEEMFKFLKRNKFKTDTDYLVTSDIELIKQRIDEIDLKREELDFLIDGAVVKVNNFDVRSQIGYTEKFPKWAVAFKFEAEEVTTILLSLEWNVGRTGKLTPIAHLEPAELSGATVRRATLNNVGDIERKKVKIGSRVLIRRSNDVIPEILGVTEHHDGDVEITPPTVCPSCGSELVEVGANLFCPNEENCPPQLVQALTHFGSKDAMDIDGFSEKTALLLYEQLGVIHPYMLYELNEEKLLTLEGFKAKKAKNLLKSIEKSKSVQLSSFIYALGISNVGKKLAKTFASEFKTLQALKDADFERLISIDDVGDIVAESVVNFFKNSKNAHNIDMLLSVGVKIKEEQKTEGVFSEEKVVLTGSLEKYSRSEAGEIIERLGGELESSVTNRTTMVLAGEKAGSKLEKAMAKGIRIITEPEFLAIISEFT